jgi:peptide-methionine (R)-S-oxide reductase
MPDRRDVLRTGVCAGALLLVPGFAAGADPKGGTFEITRTDAEWRKLLTPEQFYILRQHGTERAFSHPLDREYRPGSYSCAGCQLPLFSSTTKYDSGTGWPSFHTPLENAIGTRIDRGFFMTRTEVHCRRCGGHLGHVFDDGPRPTGLRYCMNGTALIFTPEGTPEGGGAGKS